MFSMFCCDRNIDLLDLQNAFCYFTPCPNLCGIEVVELMIKQKGMMEHCTNSKPLKYKIFKSELSVK